MLSLLLSMLSTSILSQFFTDYNSNKNDYWINERFKRYSK